MELIGDKFQSKNEDRKEDREQEGKEEEGEVDTIVHNYFIF